MNAVSSNYPNAQSTQTDQNVDFSQHCTLGDRAEGNYYFAADSAEGLNDVFNSIYDDFGSSATSPIKSETVIGGEDIGYLTFTDTLGDYMEVKNFKSIIFAGQEFTQVESQDSALLPRIPSRVLLITAMKKEKYIRAATIYRL